MDKAYAYLRHARISPRKVKIVCDMIRGKDVRIAAALMENTPKAATEPMVKLLKSACANAENNHAMDPEKLYVAETFANPGKILVQIAQMPDGRNYMWVARTVERRAARYGQPGKTFAIGLGCELRHAHRLVYSEGLDLSGEIATPIGAGCRVCERDNCPQRAFPALGRALDLDEHRSTVSPYLVKQP